MEVMADGSGGGSVNIFVDNKIISEGMIVANGGAGASGSGAKDCGFGGNGGTGAITISKFLNGEFVIAKI